MFFNIQGTDEGVSQDEVVGSETQWTSLLQDGCELPDTDPISHRERLV